MRPPSPEARCGALVRRRRRVFRDPSRTDRKRWPGVAAYRHDLKPAAVLATPDSIQGSADPAFRGDPARWNPKDLLLVSLSVNFPVEHQSTIIVAPSR